MMRIGAISLLMWLVLGSTVSAQAPMRFRWVSGQVFTYRVEQQTKAQDIAGDAKAESSSKLNSIKRWQVINVDAQGTATLQLSLAALRLENITPKGDTLLFDSADPAKSDAQMTQQLSQFINQPLALIRIDNKGSVLEVKQVKFGPASRFESDLPFGVAFPDQAVGVGHSWERNYDITLDPPQGTGEKFKAAQRYTCKGATPNGIAIGVATQLKAQPENVQERVPLLQFQPEGEIIFDPASGMVRSIRLSIDKQLAGHQGEGSTYRFQSSYVEEFVGNK